MVYANRLRPVGLDFLVYVAGWDRQTADTNGDLNARQFVHGCLGVRAVLLVTPMDRPQVPAQGLADAILVVVFESYRGGGLYRLGYYGVLDESQS